jgi:DNA invertase Pin-like site-specific DNA recombinase
MLHRKLRLIGYLRTGGSLISVRDQRNMIREYCVQNGHHLIGFTEVDSDKPSFGLQEALNGLKKSDGMIAVDLDRFITHGDDRLVELRPLVERLFHSGKVLITLIDGIETATAAGQLGLIEMINDWSGNEAISPMTRGQLESTIASHYCEPQM